MISFKDYLTEAVVTRKNSLEEIKTAISDGLKAKEIPKSDYEAINSALNYKLEAEFEDKISRPHRWGGQWKEISTIGDPGLEKLFDTLFSGHRSVLTLDKTLTKVKTTSHPLYKAVKEFVGNHKKCAEDMAELKQYIVTATQKRQEAKVEKQKEKEKRFLDNASLVAVLETHLNDFVKRAEKHGSDYYDKLKSAVEKAGGLDAIAPRPKTTMDSKSYSSARAKRALYEMILSTPKSKYVAEFGKAARDDYMAWVNKMTQKIGKKVIDAVMVGSPWVNSTIKITDEKGEVEVWNTKMIINHSVYGKPFNQFPTRKK